MSSSAPIQSFQAWEEVCDDVEANAAYTQKTAICARHLAKLRAEAPDCVYVFLKLLLAKEDARVYRLRDKQWVKLLSALLQQDDSAMLEHLELGDISETARLVRSRAGMMLFFGSLTGIFTSSLINQAKQLSVVSSQWRKLMIGWMASLQ